MEGFLEMTALKQAAGHSCFQKSGFTKFPPQMMTDTEMFALFCSIMTPASEGPPNDRGKNDDTFYKILQKHRDAYGKMMPHLLVKFVDLMGAAIFWWMLECAHFDLVCHQWFKMPPLSVSRVMDFLQEFMQQKDVPEIYLYKFRQYFIWYYQHH